MFCCYFFTEITANLFAADGPHSPYTGSGFGLQEWAREAVISPCMPLAVRNLLQSNIFRRFRPNVLRRQ